MAQHTPRTVSPLPPRVALVTDERYFLHDTGAHVESAPRLRAVYAFLDELDLAPARFPRLAAREATDADLLAVHSERHVAMLRELARRGGGMIDADTIVSAHGETVARLAAGGALAAVDAVAAGEAASAFVLGRPPGHHAMIERAMGFCLYNSIAVAARYAQRQHGLRRVLILDWDVHHGNGTQDIFERDPGVLFVSLHQFPLWPPGWGWLDHVGLDEGAGRTVNVPLPPGEGDAGYLRAYEQVVRPIAASFQPELILVSAGQDGHGGDPISNMNLSAGGFAALTRLTRALAAETGARGPVLLLEGGYNPSTLPYLVAAILGELGDLELRIDDPYARPIPVSPEANRRLALLRRALRPWWSF